MTDIMDIFEMCEEARYDFDKLEELAYKLDPIICNIDDMKEYKKGAQLGNLPKCIEKLWDSYVKFCNEIEKLKNKIEENPDYIRRQLRKQHLKKERE